MYMDCKLRILKYTNNLPASESSLFHAYWLAGLYVLLHRTDCIIKSGSQGSQAR